jgi:hypothetical protein
MRAVPLFTSSRPAASPQKGLLASSETLTAECDGHRLEVVTSIRWIRGAPLNFELWINGAKVDAAGLWTPRGSQAKPVLKGELPGGRSVAVRVQYGWFGTGLYILEVDGRPLPMDIQKGRAH